MTSAPTKTFPAFPLALALTTLFTTGLALAITAASWQWSRIPADHALDRAWLYVNLATLFTTLTLWPAIALHRGTPPRAQLFWQIGTLVVAALPAMIIAAFLSNISATSTLPAIFVQLAIILFALGAITQHPRLPGPIITGTLATLAFLLPILAYLWLEFFPHAPNAFITITPAIALYDDAVTPTHAPIWPTIVYALTGLAMYFTSPRAVVPALENQKSKIQNQK